MSARRPFLSATLAKGTASKRSSIRLIGPTVPSPGTKSTSRSPAPKASPTSSRERQLADTAGAWVDSYEFRQSEIADALDDQKFSIRHTFLVPPASAMAKNRPSGDGIACQISLPERSRTEALPSSVTFNKALPDA